MAENRDVRERTPEYRGAVALRRYVGQGGEAAVPDAVVMADLLDAADIVSELAEDLRRMDQDTAINLDSWPAARRLCDLIPAVTA